MAAAAEQVEQARAVASDGFERRLREWSANLVNERREEVSRMARSAERIVPQRRGQLDRIIRQPAERRSTEAHSEIELLRRQSLVSARASRGSAFREHMETILSGASEAQRGRVQATNNDSNAGTEASNGDSEDELPYFDDHDHVDDSDTLTRLARQRFAQAPAFCAIEPG